MPPPVITHLFGGLGNQLFQFAAGRALAARLGRPLFVDASDYSRFPLRRLELGSFRMAVSQPRYYVFSDDIPWVRQHLRFRHPAV
jgi:hypothetical protein